VLTIAIAAHGLAAAATGEARAQQYPDKPVTIIVAWPAGGATDLMARMLQDAFGKALGGQAIIKNVVGAAGTIGSAEAAAAAPDGYTLLVSPIGPMVIQPNRLRLTYDPSSFAPVCKIVDATVVLMSPPNSRFKSAKDIIDVAKADPGKLAFASTGPGTIPHISMIGFSKATGISLKHVPFKGSAEVIQAMLAGTIEVFADQPNLVAQYNMTPVAVFADKRLPGFKDAPTMKELGFDLTFSIWTGMFAPKGTPEPVLAKLDAACKAALADAGVVANLTRQQQPIDYKDRTALAAFVAAEFKKAKVLIEEAGLAPK
jgi:tripartite-type tricarboxylate transporter receptor subunit TctC